MGASNVAQVLSHHADLPDAPFRVVVQMALLALDKERPPKYWGGRDHLVRAMGRGEDPSEADYRALKRAIQVLTRRGVVAVDKHAGPGHSTVYSLHLGPVTGVTQ